MLLSAIQCPQSIPWKFPFSAVPGTAHDLQMSNTVVRLMCDTRRLAGFLFSVYRNIFAAENGMELLKNPSLIGRSNHYTHNSFVALLGFVKAKAPTDWDQVIHFFIDFIESDALIKNWLHHYQDLLCQLHLCKSPYRRCTTAHLFGKAEESSGSVPWMEGRSACCVCGVEGASSEH